MATNRAYRQVFTSGEIRGKHHGGVKLVLKTQFGPWPYVLSMEFEGGGGDCGAGFLSKSSLSSIKKSSQQRGFKGPIVLIHSVEFKKNKSGDRWRTGHFKRTKE